MSTFWTALTCVAWVYVNHHIVVNFSFVLQFYDLIPVQQRDHFSYGLSCVSLADIIGALLADYVADITTEIQVVN